MKLLKSTIIASALIISTSVSAAFVDNDTYITDTITGYDWLKLTETNNLSYNQVQSNGLLNEWSYVDNVTDVSLVNMVFNMNAFQLNDFIELYGDLQRPELSESAVSWAITGLTIYDPVFGDYELDRLFLKASINPSNPDTSVYDDDVLFANLNTVEAWTGHALVRVSAVPVPAAVWLFGSGLIGLASFTRRKKA